ncbi:MAG: transcriptional regulator NrdR, partial [Clostridia bacterium]|nr:transcriptional regulator NrdR [Clostridia bacterium]
MRCLYCNCTESKVIDSRSADDEKTIRRRRECLECGRRFTTYETIEITPVLVVKSNGDRQAFDVGKVKRGIIKSCEKRPVPFEKIDELAENIAKRVY